MDQNPLPAVMSAWPRSAQLAAAFLLGATAALLGVAVWGRAAPQPLDLRHVALPVHTIDLNHASAAELRQLPGIGPALAGRMVGDRDAGTGYRTVDDLRTVSGIGPARLERLRPWLRADIADGSEMEAPAARLAVAPKKTESLKEPIDLNRATAEELQKLPGVGAKLAQRIVDERNKSPFKSVDDLRRVGGIGPKTLEKLRPFVTIVSRPE